MAGNEIRTAGEYRDYRVHVTVSFTIDVGAVSAHEARSTAYRITREVFKRNYGRARGVRTRAGRPVRLRGDRR